MYKLSSTVDFRLGGTKLPANPKTSLSLSYSDFGMWNQLDTYENQTNTSAADVTVGFEYSVLMYQDKDVMTFLSSSDDPSVSYNAGTNTTDKYGFTGRTLASARSGGSVLNLVGRADLNLDFLNGNMDLGLDFSSVGWYSFAGANLTMNPTSRDGAGNVDSTTGGFGGQLGDTLTVSGYNNTSGGADFNLTSGDSIGVSGVLWPIDGNSTIGTPPTHIDEVVGSYLLGGASSNSSLTVVGSFGATPDDGQITMTPTASP
jgi:hypothetical protein